MTLGWIDDPVAHAVTVMPTYAGDFNLDGIVDNSDLDIWKMNFGGGTDWQMGDANYDGAINGLDLDLWQQNLGKTIIQGTAGGDVVGGGSVGDSGAVTVPEPGTLAMLVAGLIGLVACVWRKRR